MWISWGRIRIFLIVAPLAEGRFFAICPISVHRENTPRRLLHHHESRSVRRRGAQQPTPQPGFACRRTQGGTLVSVRIAIGQMPGRLPVRKQGRSFLGSPGKNVSGRTKTPGARCSACHPNIACAPKQLSPILPGPTMPRPPKTAAHRGAPCPFPPRTVAPCGSRRPASPRCDRRPTAW